MIISSLIAIHLTVAISVQIITIRYFSKIVQPYCELPRTFHYFNIVTSFIPKPLSLLNSLHRGDESLKYAIIDRAVLFPLWMPAAFVQCTMYFQLAKSAASKGMMPIIEEPENGVGILQEICAFHALSLLSLIYPTWCVGVHWCEICFSTMARIPHCSCQWEGGNVWQDLAQF